MRDLDLHFRQLHEKDDTPIEMRRFCSKEDKEVPYEEIGTATSYDGEQVVLTDEELAPPTRRKTRTIDIEAFVDLAEIDPIYFDHPYFLVPAGETDGTVRAYRLLVEVMEQHRPRRARALRAAHQGVPGARSACASGALALTTMRFHDEVRPTEGHRRRGRAQEAQGEVDAGGRS